MKFRYYFLGFTLAMLAIYGLHVAYVYYFLENPYWHLTQLGYAMSDVTGTQYVAFLAILMFFLHLPILLAYRCIAYNQKNDENFYFLNFLKTIKCIFIFFVIFVSVIHISKWDYRSLRAFNDDYIDYMANNLKHLMLPLKHIWLMMTH